jgi:hypothetical protein
VSCHRAYIVYDNLIEFVALVQLVGNRQFNPTWRAGRGWGILRLMEATKNNDTRHNANLKKEWQYHLKAWRASGQTQVSYCRKNGLSRDAFQYWKHNLEGNRNDRFVEISHFCPPSSGSVVEVFIDGRLQIRIPEGVNPEQLRAVFQAVKEL